MLSYVESYLNGILDEMDDIFVGISCLHTLSHSNLWVIAFHLLYKRVGDMYFSDSPATSCIYSICGCDYANQENEVQEGRNGHIHVEIAESTELKNAKPDKVSKHCI